MPLKPDEIELQYDAKLSAMGFSSPLAQGTVQGQTVWFIVDTGAGVHTLASWLVKTAHIKTYATNARTKGSTGIETPIRAVREEEIHFKGRKDGLRLQQSVVVDLPPIFEQEHIGGLLSPQLLAPANMAAVLDLRVPRLTFGPLPTATAGTHVCQNSDSPFVNRLYAAPVSLKDLEVLMLVDTGATTSLVSPTSSIAGALSGRATEIGHAQGVGGTATITRKVPNVGLRFGGAESTLTLTIGGNASACGSSGLLGMDVLRQCRLILGASTFAWSCNMPTAQ